MRLLLRFLAALSFAALLRCSDPPETNTQDPILKPPQEQTKPPAVDYGKLDLLAGVEQRTLDNGLKVFVKEDHRLAVASVAVVYRVGSVHEPEGTSGLAHFLEHMLFKGTDKYAKGDIDRITSRGGGANNAFTEDDYTLYWFNVASDALDDALQIQASMMRGATLDQKEFDGERGVMIEELNGMLDSPDGQLRYEIDPAVFQKHSYRRPGWGTKDDLKTVKHEVLKEFYRKYYGPNNAAIVIIGDLDRAKTVERVKELFGGIPEVEKAEPPTAREPPQRAENRVEIETDKSLDRIGLAWRTDVAGSDEDIALDVIQCLLTRGQDSRLHKRLILKDRSASSVDAVNNSRRYDGVFYVFVEAAEESAPAQAEKAVLEELDALKTKDIGDRELQKAKNLITADFIFGKETARDLAEGIASSEGLGAPDYLRGYLSRINAVTPETLRRVAEAVFRPENRTVLTAEKQKRRASLAAPQSGVEFGEYRERRLANGLTILIKPRSGLPIVSIRAYVNAGALTEPEDKAGVAMLTGTLLDQGFGTPDGRTMSAEQIAESIEFTGAQLAASAEGLDIKTLTRDAGTMLGYVHDLLLYPSFPKEEFDRCRDEQIDRLKLRMEDSPSEEASELWLREAYAGHPVGRPPDGRLETLQKLTRADVVAHHRAFYRPDNTIIAVAGDIDPDWVMEEVGRRFADWRADGPTVIPTLPKVTRQEKAKTVVEYRKTREIHVCLGHVSIPYDDPDYYALRVFEQVLCNGSAFTGRLTRVVREERHLAYNLWAGVTALDRYPAPFIVYMGSSSENGMKARDAAIEVIKSLLADGPNDEEFETARSYLVRSVALRWESAEDLTAYMIDLRRLGLGVDWAKRCRDGIAAVTKADVLRAAKAHLSPEVLTTAIVGPVDKEGKVMEDGK